MPVTKKQWVQCGKGNPRVIAVVEPVAEKAGRTRVRILEARDQRVSPVEVGALLWVSSKDLRNCPEPKPTPTKQEAAKPKAAASTKTKARTTR